MTIDPLFSGALTLALLIGGTAAIGSDMINPRAATGPAARVVMLPAITVTAHRTTLAVAAENVATEPKHAE